MNDKAPVSAPVEQRTIEHVPVDERHGRARDLFTVWFGSNIMLLTIITGALATTVFGLPLWAGACAIILGNVIGGVVMALHAAQGPQMGVPQMLQTPAQFGSYGSLLVVVLVVFMHLGFFVSNAVLGGQALAKVTGLPTNWSITIIGLISVVATIVGYRLIHRDMVGKHTEITDLGGASLLPGFVDAHAHPVAAGMAALRCDLSGLAHDRQSYLTAIAEYAARHPGETVIAGAGWYGDAFPDGFPTRHDIDVVVSDRPVILTSHDYHGAWVNTRALELAGITSATADPAVGRIIRDHAGEPTGVLLDRGGDGVNALIPEVTQEFMHRALLEAQRRLHSVGVTGWQDAAVGAEFFGLKDNFATYVEADEAGGLTARVVGAFWWEAEQGAEQLGDLCARRSLTGHSRFTASMVKVMQDGICENCTAAMLAPYRAVAGHDIQAANRSSTPRTCTR